MRNEPGIYATTKLLRRSPFDEWTLVYYDPEKTNPERIVQLMKAHRCPRAKAVKNPFVQNPIAAPGDAFALDLKNIDSLKLPDNWVSRQGPDGKTWIQTVKSAKRKVYQIEATTRGGKTHMVDVEIVSRIH